MSQVDRQTPPEAATESGGEMTPDQLAEAQRYGRLELQCDLADKGIDLVYLAVMTLLFARTLDGWLAGFVPAAGLRLAVMFAIVTGLHLVVSFPLSLYSGFVVEHRFGLSRQTLGRWLNRYAKRNALTIAFGLAMFEALYGIIWWTGAELVVDRGAGLFRRERGARPIGSRADPAAVLQDRADRSGGRGGVARNLRAAAKAAELSRRMARLAAGTGLSIEGVYRMDLSSDTAKANAMLAGLGRTRR